MDQMMTTLYGRVDETRALCEAYEACFQSNATNPEQHLVFVHGSSGSGKTALVNHTLRPLLEKQNGLLLTGKADATAQWSSPYDVFVSAFQRLVKLLSKDPSGNPEDAVRDELRNAIRGEFGCNDEVSDKSDDGLLLSSIIPGFEKVLWRQAFSQTEQSTQTKNSAAAEHEGLATTQGTDAAVVRLKFLLSRLCRTVAVRLPLVLFLDDIQWCDRASLQLLKSILLSPDVVAASNKSGSSLMVVCAYRDDEEYMSSKPPESYIPRSEFSTENTGASVKSQLLEFLEDWKEVSTANDDSSCHFHLHDVYLKSVDEATLDEILSGMYGLPQTEFYSQFIFRVSSGNIYIALQCVRQLCEEGLLYRSEETNEWKWDFSQLQAQDDATAQFHLNPAFSDIVRHGLTRLSEPTQHVLSVASCFGTEIEMEVLSLLFRDEESDIVPSIEKVLEEAMNEGLIVLDPIIGRYAFAHDRVQQAALALIDDVDRLSFEVGYRLWRRCTTSLLRSKLFAVVALLNKGRLTNGGEDDRLAAWHLPVKDCFAVARLNLEAAEKSTSIAAFADATRYLEAGVAQLIRGSNGRTYWQDDYNLTLGLLSALAEVQVWNRNFDRVDDLVHEVCSNAKCLNDECRVLMARMNSISLQGRVQDAIDIGIAILRRLGVTMSPKGTLRVLLSEVFLTTLALRGKSNDVLMDLPQMEDADKVAAANVINSMFYFTLFQGGYVAVLATKSIRLCLRYGASSGSALSFTMYGVVLCGMGSFEEGFRYGELGMALLEKHKSREILSCLHLFFYYCIHHRKRPLREGIEGLKKGSRVGMEVGDVDNAMANEGVRAYHCLFMGMNLEQLRSQVGDGLEKLKSHSHPVTFDGFQTLLQVVDTLSGRIPYEGVSEFRRAIDDRSITVATEAQTSSILHQAAVVAYIFRDYPSAYEMVSKNTKALRKVSLSSFLGVQLEWVDGMTSVAMAREGKDRKRNVANAKRILKRFAKRARESPSNCGHLHDLLGAELNSLAPGGIGSCTMDKEDSLLQQYDLAMESAVKEGFIQVAAIAAERAGDHLMRSGDTEAGHGYWREARSWYMDWGATAKARSLASLMTTQRSPY